MKFIIWLSCVTFIGFGCSLKPLTADEIVEKAIEKSGVMQLKQAAVSFWFRDAKYLYRKSDKSLLYQRKYQRDDLQIKETFDGTQVTQTINGIAQSFTSKKASSIKSSLNSVMYFAFLPLQLADPAVNFRTTGVNRIKGKDYFVVEVTFNEQGGGEDHDDIFEYWFDCETFSMDYMAYKYNTNGGGMRFRAAKNKRRIAGVVIQDYDNFAPKVKGSVPLRSIGKIFDQYGLQKLSEINLKEVKIDLLE